MNTISAIFASFSRRERIIFFTAGLFFIAGILTLVAVIVAKTTVSVATPGGRYIEGVVGQPVYINPIIATSETDKLMGHLLFASLPELTSQTTYENGGRIAKIRLKEDLLWSDGHKITADDVVFTIQRIQDQEAKSPLLPFFQGVVATRTSELEVQLSLVSPYAFFEDHLKYLHIVPKHIFGETPIANWKLSKYNLEPVGSGPYKLQSAEKLDSGFISTYHLVANENYSGDAAFIQNFDVRFFSKIEDVVQAFNSGSISGFGSFDPDVIAGVSRSRKISTFALPSYYAVFFNQERASNLQDKKVREALRLAIDTRKIADEALGNMARPIQAPLDSLIINEDIPEGQIDVAKRHLEEAGWLQGVDGFREKKSSKGTSTLSVTLTVPDIRFLNKAAQMIKGSWEAIGVKTEIISVPTEEMLAKKIRPRDYEAVLFGNIFNPPFDMYAFWHSNEKFSPGLNLAMYSNKKADTLIELIRRELDADSRVSKIKELNELIYSDSPAVFLFAPNYFEVTTKELRGVNEKSIMEPVDRFLGVSEWHLKTKLELK